MRSLNFDVPHIYVSCDLKRAAKFTAKTDARRM